ncbi:hypothetical protein B0O99DRAFT_591388 [Bisporella sp. PMI_857]|nr:hypothetical protein B0O99DRAFT_591388 [Bisporella sp. PMI_857]
MAPKPSAIRKLLAPFRNALGNPQITGPVLLALLLYPERLRDILPASLSWLTSKAVVRAIGFFFGLSLVRLVNGRLSQRQLNNWRKDAVFKASEELVLITGGAGGIGALMAKQFAELGAKVVVLDLYPPSDPPPKATGITFYKCDVTSTSEISAVAAEIRKAHGDPTVLINNAGVATCKSILGTNESNVRKTFEVNTLAHFWTVREFLPAMIKRNHGHVVTIASMASFAVHAQNVDYCCTKASALAFHEGLASELKSRYNAPDVKTTIAHPTWTNTPLIGPAFNSAEFKELILEAEPVAASIVKQVVSGRSAQLILPPEANIITTLRAWPSWMQERVRNKIAPQLAFFPGRDI